jgi:hypothetical protein
VINDIAFGAFQPNLSRHACVIPYHIREWAWAIRRIVSLRILRDCFVAATFAMTTSAVIASGENQS